MVWSALEGVIIEDIRECQLTGLPAAVDPVVEEYGRSGDLLECADEQAEDGAAYW